MWRPEMGCRGTICPTSCYLCLQDVGKAGLHSKVSYMRSKVSVVRSADIAFVNAAASAHRPELMEACAAWARGGRFADVLKMTPDVFEGSLVRAVRRVEELMRQVGANSTC